MNVNVSVCVNHSGIWHMHRNLTIQLVWPWRLPLTPKLVVDVHSSARKLTSILGEPERLARLGQLQAWTHQAVRDAASRVGQSGQLSKLYLLGSSE